MRQIEVSDETYENIKDQLGSDSIEVNSYEDFIGMKLYFRTVTYHVIGKVEKKIGTFFQLSDASWVADSGRFQQAIDDGVLDEVEPVKVTAWVNLSSCVDIYVWNHELPREQK